MASLVNPYFPKGVSTEQNLINGLIKESIQVMGRTYQYLPREIQREDLVLGEDVISKFGLAIPIEMYMADNTGFEGQKEMFSKFGLQIQNSFTLVVSKDRWESEVQTQFDNNALNGEATFDVKTNLRPQEGDLIYDSLTDSLFEIKFVDHDAEFYQLGKNYMYHLSCELFIYENEKISTGVADIDDFNKLSMDLRENQILLETGFALMQEECDDMLILDIPINPATIIRHDYGTEFTPSATDINFTVTNPFGDL